jgi:ADP-ribosylglycohydrolase
MNAEPEEVALLDRIRGALLGGLCGDEIGRPAEGLDHRTLARLLGRITGPLDEGDSGGAGTDDTALKHMLCEAIVRAGARTVTPDDWAAVWRERMDPAQFFVPVQNAYFKLIVEQVPAEECGVGNMLSNSSAMAISPIGIVNAGDARAAYAEATSAARLIHRGVALEAAGAVAAAVAAAFRSGATVETVLEASLSSLPAGGELRFAIEAALALARSSSDYEDFRERFYEQLLRPWPNRKPQRSIAVDPRETVPTALAVFLLAGGDPTETILGCANFGRDADTAATIGGAIAGALRGGDALPPHWLDFVAERTPVDQEDLALRLLGILRLRVGPNGVSVRT